VAQGTKIWIPTEEESDKRQPSEWIPAEVVTVVEQDSKITIRFPDDPKRVRRALLFHSHNTIVCLPSIIFFVEYKMHLPLLKPSSLNCFLLL
jgi:hypothetical protein